MSSDLQSLDQLGVDSHCSASIKRSIEGRRLVPENSVDQSQLPLGRWQWRLLSRERAAVKDGSNSACPCSRVAGLTRL